MNAILKLELLRAGETLYTRAGNVCRIIGTFVRCPCCGHVVDFRRSA